MRQKITFFSMSLLFVLTAAQTPTPMPPSKVQGVTVTRTSRGSYPSVTVSLSVSWNAISESGITYTVCYSTTSGTQSDPPPGANCGTIGITGTSTTLGSLSRGTTYYIWVAAVSSGGRGPYSDKKQETTYQVPSRVNPPSLTKAASSGKPAIRVTWTAPSSDLTITEYHVLYVKRGGSRSTEVVTSTSTTLEDLSAGTEYFVYVRALSNIGVGLSSETRTITTYQVPSQVGPPVLTKAASSGKPALGVTWTAPSSERPITKYEVGYRIGDARWSTEDVRSPPTTLENLSAGTSYQVQVRAVSDVGTGQYSLTRTITTYQVPEQVTGVEFTLENTSNALTLTITWDRPFSELRIVRYDVAITENKLNQYTRMVGGESTTTLTIPSDQGNTYTFRVSAVSAVGSGKWSGRVTAKPPSRPVIGVITPSTTTLTVRWDDEGFSYRLHVQKKGSTEINTFGPVTPPHNITGLESNTEYTVVVEAYNPLGSANGSIVGYTLSGVPGPVSNLSYNITSDTSAKIMWSEPEEPNGEITGYDVLFGDYGSYSGHKVESVTRTMKELMDLSPEIAINVTVQAKNTVGLGKPNSVTFFTKEGVPRVAPRNVTVVRINSTAISVFWNPLTLQEARGWPVYVVYLWGSSQRTACELQSVNTSDSSVVIGNLDPVSSYSVVVQVSTAAGTSEELKSQPVILVNIKKNGLDADLDTSSDGLSAGLFIAGLFSGVIALLLVEGIICGVWKISKMSQKKNIEGDYADPTNLQMTECPAYESIDREGKGAERVYEDIGSRDTKGN